MVVVVHAVAPAMPTGPSVHAQQRADLEAMADRMVVSEMGVTWSPNTAPLRMLAMVLCMRPSSVGAARNMALVAMGNMMDTACMHRC